MHSVILTGKEDRPYLFFFRTSLALFINPRLNG
nr:MAG TPA: hypothetical protein [Caudoviricetes sp.]